MSLLDSNMSWDNKDDVDKFYNILDSMQVKKNISLEGDVMIISNTPIPLQD